MKIAVVGTGYVGLVSGVCLAAKGHEVICVDKLQDKVDKINAGVAPIYEKGLEDLLKDNIGKRLTATTDLESAIQQSDLSLIAVGTPFDGSEIDLSYIRIVTAEIGAALSNKQDFHVVTVKSTVVPGTTDGVVLPILEQASGKRAGVDFGVAMNPEFLREGNAISDFMQPDRIVLGGINDRSIDVLVAAYAPFAGVDVLKTNTRTAEMIKYTANSFLATMISFSNEIGNLCATIGDIDATDVMKGVHLDRRLSPILEDGTRITPSSTTYLEAGCGFGGSCFPKDVKALVSHGQKYGNDMSLLAAVVDVNRVQPMRMIELIEKHHRDFEGLNVAILGLAFKPETDDMRESPAIPVIEALLERQSVITAYDPIAQEQAELTFKDADIRYAETLEAAIENVEVIVIMTRWAQFETLPELLRGKAIQPLVVDGRRMLSRESVTRYEGIGV